MRGLLRLMVIATAALVAAVAFVACGGEDEADIASRPTPVSCADAEPPAETLELLGVLRREPTDQDAAPRSEVDRWLAALEEDAAKVWPDRLRLAWGEGGRAYWVVPVLIGEPCEKPGTESAERFAGACVLILRDGDVDHGCAVAEQIREGAGVFGSSEGRTSDPPSPSDYGRNTFVALIPDGYEADLTVGDREYKGELDGNVARFAYPDPDDTQHLRLRRR